MKHMNEHERILAIFGVILTSASLVLSLMTEVSARRHISEFREATAKGGVVQQGAPAARVDRHIGYEQQTLASRWSIPDGHASLGAGFALFGLVLIVVPRATSRKRVATS
jgi:membrane-associated phospholipid phosphatase